MDLKNSTIIDIIYECSGTQLGESVFLIGSIPLLGNWDIKDCFEMYTDSRIYPRWTAKLIVPSGITFEYKFLIANRENRSIIRWEVLPYKYNRILTSPEWESFTIFEREGMYERSIQYTNPTFGGKEMGLKLMPNHSELNYSGFMNEIREEGQFTAFL